MEFRTIQTSFVSGELGEHVQGRRETPQLRNAARVMMNCWPRAHGGAQSRPGFWVSGFLPGRIGHNQANTWTPDVVDWSKGVRLTAMVPDTPNFGYLIAVYVNRPGYEGGRVYVQPYRISASASPTRVLTPCNTSGLWLELPEAIKDSLEKLRFCGAYDTLFIAHPNMPMKVLRRTGDLTFEMSDYTIEAGTAANAPMYRFAPPNVLIKTTSPKAPGDQSMVLTQPYFVQEHVGLRFRIFDSTTKKWVYGRCTAVWSATTATFNMEAPGLTQNVDMPRWEEEAWAPLHGYPTSVCFFEQRLVVGGSRDCPDAIWMSRSNAYFNFNQGEGEDDAAIALTLAASGDGAIKHVVGARYLMVLHDNAARYFEGAPGKALTPTNIVARHIGPYGAHDADPVVIDDALVYWQRDCRTLRRLVFDLVENRIRVEAANLVAPDMEIGRKHASVCTLNGSAYGPEEIMVSPVVPDATRSAILFHSGEGGRISQIMRVQVGGPDSTIEAACSVKGELWTITRRGNAGSLDYLNPSVPNVSLDGAMHLNLSAPGIYGPQFWHLRPSAVVMRPDGELLSANAPIDAEGNWYNFSYTGPVVLGQPFEWRVRTFPVKFDAGLGEMDTARLRVTRVGVLAGPSDPVQLNGTENFTGYRRTSPVPEVILDDLLEPILDDEELPIIGSQWVSRPPEHIWRYAGSLGWQLDGSVTLTRDPERSFVPVSVLSLARRVRV